MNVALLPILVLLRSLLVRSGVAFENPDLYRLVVMIGYINLGILIFNLLPIYPLDGGQILRSLLWFPFGRVRSLQIASVIGLIGGGLLTLYAITTGSMWLVLMTFFLLSQAVTGWRRAKALQLDPDEAVRTPQPSSPERPPVL